uniref:Uncharacterized protein n=1 Tax=Arundo donax TaxID=35708 RepID=A0A0A9F0F4_ARUDO
MSPARAVGSHPQLSNPVWTYPWTWMLDITILLVVQTQSCMCATGNGAWLS